MGVIRGPRRNTLASDEEADSLHHLLDEIVIQEQANQEQQVEGRGDTPAGDALLADEAAARAQRRAERKMQRRAPKGSPRPEPTFQSLGCRGKGQRRNRRLQNGNHALLHAINMCGFDPECDRSMGEDIDIYDFIPYSSSPFSRLLEEKENMRAWNSFLSKSEEDQRSFLKLVQRSEQEENDGRTWEENSRGCLVQRKNRSGKNRCPAPRKNVPDQENACDKLADGSKEEEEEEMGGKPVQHPAFSPELSFARVDERIKRIFRKSRRVPIDLLDRMEDEVCDFFEAGASGVRGDGSPSSVYQSCLPSWYQRMLLHATSQYLNLVCKSVTRNGVRWSQIRNEQAFGHFCRPSVRLTSKLDAWVQDQLHQNASHVPAFRSPHRPAAL